MADEVLVVVDFGVPDGVSAGIKDSLSEASGVGTGLLVITGARVDCNPEVDETP